MRAFRLAILASCVLTLAACTGATRVTGGAAPAPNAAASATLTLDDGQGAAAERASASDASTERSAQAAADERPDIVCERVQETGTHRRVRRCYSRTERERTREESQEFLREAGRQRVFPGAAN